MVGLASIAVACSSSDSTQEAETSSSPQPSSASTAPTASQTLPPPSPPSPSGPPAGFISRASWTDGPWPLTVEDAVLECQGTNAVTITAGETKYALNAASSGLGLPDYADAIGVLDPDKPGMHLDAKPLIAKGLTLCGSPPASTPGAPTGGSNPPAGLVERETWNDGPWPFTVDYATLLCNKGADGERVLVVADREMYALNGTAKASKLYPPFDAIWADDPNGAGLKVNIGPMIDRGVALCD